MSSPSASGTRWVAGVDACGSGWVVVLRDVRSGAILARVAPNLRAVLALPQVPAVIAVHVPIGLLATGAPGGRACEKLARQILGARRSRVFSAPTRAALAAFRNGASFQAVSVANRAGNA